MTCTTVNDRLAPCKVLRERVDVGRGLHWMVVVDDTRHGFGKRKGVLHGTGNKAHVLNFCPWCGTDLRPAFASLAKEEVAP